MGMVETSCTIIINPTVGEIHVCPACLPGSTLPPKLHGLSIAKEAPSDSQLEDQSTSQKMERAMKCDKRRRKQMLGERRSDRTTQPGKRNKRGERPT